jgi:hypothetical protein
MAEALAIVGAAASVLSIVRLASAVTRKLSTILGEIKKAPDDVKELLQAQQRSNGSSQLSHAVADMCSSFQQALSSVAALVQDQRLMVHENLQKTCEDQLSWVIASAVTTLNELDKLLVIKSSSLLKNTSCFSRRRRAIRLRFAVEDAKMYQQKLESYSKSLLFILSIINV